MEFPALTSQDPTKTLLEAYGEFLRLHVADGDASPDTLRTYHAAAQAWVDWCRAQGIEPATATEYDVRRYRHHLVVDLELAPATVAHRLTVVRRLYQAAVWRGLRRDNPAAGVRAPKAHRSEEDVLYLTQEQLQAVLDQLQGNDERTLRDRVIVALMGLQGLRTVEVQRACVEDIREDGSMRVRGKGGRERVIYLRPDVQRAIRVYLRRRRPVQRDDTGTPLVTNLATNNRGHRISRRGLQLVVDRYLRAAEVKQPRLGAHALRHTYATLGYAATKDLRAVQEDLGHASPRTTTRYAHLVDRRQRSPANRIKVKL